MTDFFKSAFGIISGGGPGVSENDFVGQIVELGNQKLRVKKVIASGYIRKLYLPLTLLYDFQTVLITSLWSIILFSGRTCSE
jgi:hypothetical protein